jgi:hypothetical protein
VTIISAPGDAFRRAVEQFKATYPWLELDVRGEHIRDTLPRILREREADIYSTDVMIGAIGAGVFQEWLPRGVLDPLEQAAHDGGRPPGLRPRSLRAAVPGRCGVPIAWQVGRLGQRLACAASRRLAGPAIPTRLPGARLLAP